MCAGRRSATAADSVDGVGANEICQFARKLRGRFGIDRLAGRTHERKAGVRNNADAATRTFAQVPDCVAHLGRTGRTVQANDVDRQRVQRRRNGANIRTQQHPAFLNQGRLRLYRNAPQAALEFADDAGDRGFKLEQILHRLEQQHIDAASTSARACSP